MAKNQTTLGEVQLEVACTAALRAALPPRTVIAVKPAEDGVEGGHVEGWLGLPGLWGETGIPIRMVRRINPATLALMDRRLREHRRARLAKRTDAVPRWILFTEHVTPRVAVDLRARGIAFADTCGNVHLAGPGLHVWVTGNRPTTRRPRTPRLSRGAAARLLFVLLQDPRRAQEPYRTLARQADVAPDTVQKTFDDLQNKGYLKVWGAREREVVRLPGLLELWTSAYEDGLRPKLQPKRCDRVGGGPIDELAHLLPGGPDQVPVFLGGEVAAASLTGQIRPTTATLHVPPGKHIEVMRALQLIPRPEGPITLLHTFGTTNEWTSAELTPTRLADPLLVYAELLRVGDDRARAAAEAIYDSYIVARFPSDK